jgi:dihydroorotate dehydrogenase
MIAGGLLATVIASTRVVLPYDESLCGMTRGQLASLNPRLLPFMAHDRVSLAGAMLSIGIFYAALGWFGVRRGAHWAHVTVLASSIVGFFTFFSFLGFGYFDPFHAFVTAILLQFTLLCMVLPRSAAPPPMPEWRESAAWRRGLWGQLLFILIGVGLTGAGVVITLIACTSVFVETDLAYMRTTAAQLRLSYERLVPLVAHDRASLGGMLIANGLTVWLSAQWGFRAGARWLWTAFAWGGNVAFAAATAVHFVVGYGSLLHLLPAFLGWGAWNVALALSRGWLVGDGSYEAYRTLEPAGPAGRSR